MKSFPFLFIIGILDSKLKEVVKYSYDSWGNVLNIVDGQGEPITDENHIGHINAYRYRGYRYDKETGLYYLQSRYYNPQWGRFVNADKLLAQNNTLTGNNMYEYCANNPINLSDPTGLFYWNQLRECIKNIGAGILAIIRLGSFHETPKKYYPNTANKIDGSQSNAFKHINMSAKLTYDSGKEFAKKLTNAHEKDVPNPKRQSEMDLRNNEIGIEIGDIVSEKMQEYQEYKNPNPYTSTINTGYIPFNYNISYLGKNFMFNPRNIDNLIEEMSYHAVQSGIAIVVVPDAGN